jgi:hypothetical protein
MNRGHAAARRGPRRTYLPGEKVHDTRLILIQRSHLEAEEVGEVEI